MEYVNYIKHVIYTPDIYHMRFDFAVEGLGEVSKRVAIAALPFIALYRPAGVVLSVGMNGTRAFSHLQKLFLAEESGTWREYISEGGKATLAILALAATVYGVAFALLITTSFDLIQTIQSVCAGNGDLIEEGLQGLSSACYLGFMLAGGLEAMLVFSLLQGLCSFYQAKNEFKEKRWIEVIAKIGLGFLRMKQAHGYVKQIKRRDSFLQVKKIRAVAEKILRARQASHLVHHPLSSLKDRIDSKEVVLEDHHGERSNFGSHFHGFGHSLVKGENLTFRTKMVDGKEVIEFDFKVNHAFRAEVDQAIGELKGLQGKEFREVLGVLGSHAEGVSLGSGSFFDGFRGGWYQVGEAHEIKISGLGTVTIGKTLDDPNLYDRVVVQMDTDKTVYDLHEILALMNLDTSLHLSTRDDIERLKMGHLFRTFFPREATPFERTKEFFELPLDQLKDRMIAQASEMKSVFEKYYDQMSEEHIFDGRVRYRIAGLADAARKEGAKALTAAITGVYGEKDLFDRVASILKIGMISTEVRKENGFDKDGLGGGGVDFKSGGADSVYTQGIYERNCREHMSFDEFWYQSDVRLLISLEALELGSYQYDDGYCGCRIYEQGDDSDDYDWWGESPYKSRDSILEFVQKHQRGRGFAPGHEIMLKERVAPSFIQGLVVPDQKTKTNLINYLQGLDLSLSKPLDQFIHVSDHVSEELFIN